MKNILSKSRQATPWDNKKDLDSLQLFIMDKYKENYKNKHPKLKDTNEYQIFNSIVIKNCKYCNSVKLIKFGKDKNGIQEYYCKECKRKFNITKNTIFENHKIPLTEWIEFLLGLFNYSSSSLSSKNNKNSDTTTSYWLHKVFLVLENYQNDIVLEENVYIDELFYSVIKSDIKKKGDKKLRGLSINQICIGIGYDNKKVLAMVEGVGKTSTKKTNEIFLSHIKTTSTLIHDDEKAHKVLINKLNLKDVSYKSKELKKLNDDKNPLRPINHHCDLLRQFLNAHSGFDRKYTQGYLNLYCFIMNPPFNKLEKIYNFFELALNTKTSLKYRDLFKIQDK